MSDSRGNGHIKVLLVEDDPLLVKLYETAFKLLGHEVEVAFDGEEGLRKVREMEKKPTVILSDIMMPKMNGLDMLRKIKEDPDLKKIPVVFLTNLAEEKNAETGLSLGAVAYIVKSQYTPKEVVEKLKEIIEAYDHGENIPAVKTKIKSLGS